MGKDKKKVVRAQSSRKKVKKETQKTSSQSREQSKAICNDKKCPFHGQTIPRGRVFVGKIVRAKMERTVIVEWERKQYIPKYERFEKRRSRVKAHNPACINAKEGEIVKIAETRPLSKTKHFVVVEVIKR